GGYSAAPEQRASETSVDALSVYPNPFNPSTRIEFKLVAPGLVSLRVYDLVGREVAKLVNGEREAGVHTVVFDASKLPSGVYFSKLEVTGKTTITKLLLLK
ncbi:MAG: T9SS type A sorting domain-containing protein, partial [Bacteroidota bacterium]